MTIPSSRHALAEYGIPLTREPVATCSQGVYRYEWGEPFDLRVEVAYLRTERSGEVTGEVTIVSTAAERSDLLHHARFTLTSTRSRQEVAKHAQTRTPGQPIDWIGVIDTAAVTTVRRFRAGEPDVLLRDLSRPEGAGYLIAPLVLERHPTIWFGDGGDAKSYLALAAAATIQSGRSDILGFAPATTKRVLYVDFEFAGEDHRDRLERLCGPDMPDVAYVRCAGALPYELERIQRIVADRAIEFLVVDSVAFACDAPPESAEAAQHFYAALRQIGLGALCVAHTTKAEGGDQKPFGSVFWHNGARATWYVKRSDESSASELALALFNRKANTGPRSLPVGFRVAFDDDARATTIRALDVADISDLASRLSIRVRMERKLGLGPMTTVELASAIEEKVESVERTARRYHDKVFTKVAGQDGIYRLALLETRRDAA